MRLYLKQSDQNQIVTIDDKECFIDLGLKGTKVGGFEGKTSARSKQMPPLYSKPKAGTMSDASSLKGIKEFGTAGRNDFDV